MEDEEIDDDLEGMDEHEGSEEGLDVTQGVDVIVISLGVFSKLPGTSLVVSGGVILLARSLTLTGRFARHSEILER